MAEEPQMLMSDETLMALADGELPSDLAKKVMASVKADPELQARLRMFTETRRLLRDDAMHSQPSPREDALIAQIRAAALTPPATTAAPTAAVAAANLNRRPLAAIAAALAAAVFGLGWWWQSGDGHDSGAMPAAQVAALEGLMSGDTSTLPDGQGLTMIASYLTGAGDLCREFETHSDGLMTIIVACRDEAGWTQHFATNVTAQQDYVPASGEIEALDTFLANAGVGAPLTPDEETAALAK